MPPESCKLYAMIREPCLQRYKIMILYHSVTIPMECRHYCQTSNISHHLIMEVLDRPATSATWQHRLLL